MALGLTQETRPDPPAFSFRCRGITWKVEPGHPTGWNPSTASVLDESKIHKLGVVRDFQAHRRAIAFDAFSDREFDDALSVSVRHGPNVAILTFISIRPSSRCCGLGSRSGRGSGIGPPPLSIDEPTTL